MNDKSVNEMIDKNDLNQIKELFYSNQIYSINKDNINKKNNQAYKYFESSYFVPRFSLNGDEMSYKNFFQNKHMKLAILFYNINELIYEINYYKMMSYPKKIKSFKHYVNKYNDSHILLSLSYFNSNKYKSKYYKKCDKNNSLFENFIYNLLTKSKKILYNFIYLNMNKYLKVYLCNDKKILTYFIFNK